MFKNVLVPLHLAYVKNHKKLFTGALKVLEQDEGRLSLLYVNENRQGSVYPVLDEEGEKHQNEDAFQRLKEIAQEHQLPRGKISFNIRNGSVHRETLEEAHRVGADAIVMMATKPSLGSYFISSTAERVIRHAACSVFVIRLTDY